MMYTGQQQTSTIKAATAQKKRLKHEEGKKEGADSYWQQTIDCYEQPRKQLIKIH